MSEEKGFLARWSKRKQEAAREAPSRVEEAPAAEVPAEPELDLASLPSLEEITEATDIRLFLQKGVPETLRNAALRRAWALDPAIRNYVGEALDYAYDWNTPGGVPGNGALPATYNVAEAVSRMLSDLPALEADQQQTNTDLIGKPDPRPKYEEGHKNDAAPANESVLGQNLQQSVLVTKAEFQDVPEMSTRDSDIAPPKAPVRRHGSALPRP